MRSEASRQAKREYQRRYYAANRERIIARTGAHQKAHRNEFLAYLKVYNKRPDVQLKRQQYMRSPGGVVVKYRTAAKQRGLDWALPDMLALDLITDNCFYCGDTPDPTNGIDRVDNFKGYVEGNVVTACKHCNAAKLTRSREDFECWALRVARHIQPSTGKFYNGTNFV